MNWGRKSRKGLEAVKEEGPRAGTDSVQVEAGTGEEGNGAGAETEGGEAVVGEKKKEQCWDQEKEKGQKKKELW